MFALLHGAIRYGYRGTVVFIGLCVLIGGGFELLGISTGFPYGSYSFTSVMGPKVLGVPILLAFAYVGMGYLSWTIAILLLNAGHTPLIGRQVLTVTLVASAVMVAWDLCMDPIWSMIDRAWIWRSGGMYFGVPLTNFAGWFLTVYVIYQAFALLIHRRATCHQLPSEYWQTAVFLYATSAAGNLLLIIPRPPVPTTVDAAGVFWSVRRITATCFLLSILTMGSFTLLAWMRIHGNGDQGHCSAGD
jgi:putative membrane protein